MYQSSFFQNSNKEQLVTLKNTIQSLKNNETMSETDKIANFKKIAIKNAAILKNPRASKEIIIAAYIQLAELYANVSFLYSKKNSMGLAIKGYSQAIKCIDHAETIFNRVNQDDHQLDYAFISACNTDSCYNPSDAKQQIKTKLSPHLLDCTQSQQLFKIT